MTISNQKILFQKHVKVFCVIGVKNYRTYTSKDEYLFNTFRSETDRKSLYINYNSAMWNFLLNSNVLKNIVHFS